MTNTPRNKKGYWQWSIVFIIWALGLWGLSRLELSSVLVPIISCLFLVLMSCFLLKNTEFFSGKVENFSKIKLEFAKISWSGLGVAKKTSLMVGLLIVLFAVIMWAVDSIFTYVVKLLL